MGSSPISSSVDTDLACRPPGNPMVRQWFGDGCDSWMTVATGSGRQQIFRWSGSQLSGCVVFASRIRLLRLR